ncbi:hypothetical protein GC194_12510, partial [bacterium]|nr:hypothetical protein [bacterium]
QIAAPLVSRYFEENNMKEIGDLYRKTCMVQLISGLFLYLLILANLDVLFTIWRPEFASAKVVIVYLGAARLIAGSTGLNGRIIIESKYFRLNFISNLLMGALAIITNMIFIPMYGIPGAAFASALTILIVSGIKVWFVWRKFGLQPFEMKTLAALAIGAVAFVAANYLPQTGLFFADIALRSIVFSIIYIPLMLKFNLSAGINDIVYAVSNALKNS